MKNIVILGAGFGGISVAKNLIGKIQADFKIILIDKNDYHNFHPSFYEIATANLGRTEIPKIIFQNLYSSAVVPISGIFKGAKNFEFKQAEVKDLKIEEKKIYCTNGEVLDFDFLVLALGSETNFFDIPGLENIALPLKSVGEALNIRNAIQEIFERKQPHQKITIVIGGGGFTGCEFACELVSYLKNLSKIFKHHQEHISIKIIEASDDVLPGASKEAKEAARKRMKNFGIELLLGKPIISIKDSMAALKDGQNVYFDLLVWAAGIKANRLLEKIQGVKIEKGCKVLVDDCLRVVSPLEMGGAPYKNIFAVGDNIYCFDLAIQASMPATARAAILQGKIVAKNIINEIGGVSGGKCPSIPSQFVIPLGGKWAIAEIGRLKISGFFGWVIKEFIFLKYFISVLPFWKALKLWVSGLKVYIKND